MIRKLCLTLAGAFAIVVSTQAAETASTKVVSPGYTLPADADAAWVELEKSFRPPPQPAEWAGQTPTEEQRKAFTKFLGEQSVIVADKAKEFHTRFPDHPKAADAKTREERFREQAARYGGTPPPAADSDSGAEAETSIAPGLEEKLNEVHRRAVEKRPQGLPAVLKEFETGVRALIKDYPNEPVVWEQLMVVAANSEDKEQKKRVLTDVINSNLLGEEMLARARGMMRGLGAVGQPLDIAFTAPDGKEVSIQKMKGKVVLVDFWASWCGPCIASMPQIVDLYERYHDQGLEIVGINMDKDPRGMDLTIRRFKMTWPQYHDGRGWGTKHAMDYNVSAIPAMWLVDKKGILRTMEARQDLEGQIKKLLAEKL